VAVLSNGTVLASWIDEHGASRTLWTASSLPGVGWSRPVALDHGDGLGVVALRAAGPIAIEAWRDSLANENNLVAAVYRGRAWHPSKRLMRGYGPFDSIAVDATDGDLVRWRMWQPEHSRFFEAIRHGLDWRPATEIDIAPALSRPGP
jgi:hypothetical protein